MTLLEFLGIALLGISTVTGLIVEALKKILDKKNVKYSSTALAAIVSVVFSLAASVIYAVLAEVPFSAKLVIGILILMGLSFLVATVGYDKVMQAIKKVPTIQNNKDDTNNNNK